MMGNTIGVYLNLCVAIISIVVISVCALPVQAADAFLTVNVGNIKHAYSKEDLLHNPATIDVTIPKDPAYKRTMHYKALPLSALLQEASIQSGQVVQTVASDGFVANLPPDLVLRKSVDKGAVPYVAIEPPSQLWPKIRGKDSSAGPFYLVWLKPEADDIRTEQWPYGIVTIRSIDSPAKRWPALAVGNKFPQTSPVPAGQILFVNNCLACHTLNGAGDSNMGPDLNLPKNPTEYFRSDILHDYIRNPSSVRHWKDMRMTAFSKETLSDHEINLIIAYLGYMSEHKVKQ